MYDTPNPMSLNQSMPGMAAQDFDSGMAGRGSPPVGSVKRKKKPSALDERINPQTPQLKRKYGDDFGGALMDDFKETADWFKETEKLLTGKGTKEDWGNWFNNS